MKKNRKSKQGTSSPAPVSHSTSRLTRDTFVMTAMICTAGHFALELDSFAQEAAPAVGTGTTTELPGILVEGSTAPNYKPVKSANPKYAGPLRDVPQTITVIPQAVIKEQGATSLRDVLRNVPGITVIAGEGGTTLPGDNINIRGFNARTDIFVDGVRDIGSYNRDPFNYDQIEVIKGPSSSNSGRGSTGGSLNLVTKTPKLTPSYSGEASIGTDELYRVTLDFNQPLWTSPGLAPAAADLPSAKNPKQSFNFSAKGAKQVMPDPMPPTLGQETGAAFRLNGLFLSADTPGRDEVNSERWAIAPSLAFGLGTDTRLTLTYLHMEEDNLPDYGIPWVPANNNNSLLRNYRDQAPPISFETFYGLRDYDFEDITTDVAGVLFEHDFTEHLKLRNFTRYSNTDRSSGITAARLADQTTLALTRQLQRRDIENELFSNTTELNIDFNTGPVNHKLLLGGEYLHEEQSNNNSAQTFNQPNTTLYNPDSGDRPLGPMPSITSPLANHATADATVETIGFYAFDTIKFSKQWEITGGARYDRVDSDFEGNTYVVATQLNTPGKFSRTDEMFSYRAAIVYKPVENGSIYFSYGTSFNPSVEGVVGLALTTANANLKPEKSESFELGTKWDLFDEKLQVTAAIFRTDKTNARTIDPIDPLITTLNGEQRVQGAEFSFTGNVTDWWRVIGGYTYLDSEITESNDVTNVVQPDGSIKMLRHKGNRLPVTPEHAFSVWTVFDIPGGIQVGAGANYTGERYNVPSNQRLAPDYILFDAMIGYKVNEHFTVRLNAHNLADEEYIDRVGNNQFIPGAGRSFMLTGSYTF